MSGPLEVALLPASDAAADAELETFLDACPGAFAQQTVGWRNVIVGVDRDEPVYLACRRGGRLVGVLPGYRFEGPFGAILTSAPQAGPLGGVACRPDAGTDADGVYAALLSAFAALAAERGCAFASVLGNPLQPDGALLEKHFAPDYVLENVCQVIDLDPGVAEDGSFPLASSHVRRHLRRAEAGDLVVDEAQTPANVDAWYAIHETRHREIGAEPLPRALFTGALEHMVPRDKGRFFFVRLAGGDGRMVAGGFYLYHGAAMDSLMPAVDSAHAALAPNYLLAAHSIRWARARGIRHYNWQPSPPDGGVYRFKRQWGSRDAAYGYFTRVTGDAGPFLRRSPAEVRAGYPWHYVLPFDCLGGSGGARRSSRKAAWSALETSR